LDLVNKFELIQIRISRIRHLMYRINLFHRCLFCIYLIFKLVKKQNYYLLFII